MHFRNAARQVQRGREQQDADDCAQDEAAGSAEPGRVHVDDHAVVQQGLRAGVATRPLSMYQLRKSRPARGLLLGYAAVPEEEIAPNFALLAKAVGAFL